MREIKFRAWDKKHCKYTKVLKIYFGSDGSNLGALVEDYETNYAFELQANQVELEQYTGLKDKNGKEIYEGDIVTETIDDGSNKIVQVYETYWDEDMLNFGIRGTKGFNYNLHDELWETNASREVIGNIHENPELLEDK